MGTGCTGLRMRQDLSHFSAANSKGCNQVQMKMDFLSNEKFLVQGPTLKNVCDVVNPVKFDENFHESKQCN